MSAHLTTNAAEGLTRRRFTADGVTGMVRIGILDESVEPVGGEPVPTSAKGSFHEMMKTAPTIS